MSVACESRAEAVILLAVLLILNVTGLCGCCGRVGRDSVLGDAGFQPSGSSVHVGGLLRPHHLPVLREIA